MSLEAFDRGEWKTFFPLNFSYLDQDNYNNTSFENLPNEIYGKLLNGVCGYNPVWTYLTVNKKNVRIKKYY
jgi:hypothetical protein